MTTEKKPWEKIRLNSKQEANLYCDWGNHYHLHQIDKTAKKSFSDALQLQPSDVASLLGRSKCKRNLAQTENALKDLNKCAEMHSHLVAVDEGKCDCLYDLNRLEYAVIHAHDSKNKYTGFKVDMFANRVDVINENLIDSLGDSLLPFIMRNEKIFNIVARQMQEEKIIDTRPLWKKLRDEHKCDVQSIPDVEEIPLSPLELARRKREFRVFLQIYLNKSWQDVVFLRNLQDNPSFLLNYNLDSTPKLKSEICDGNAAVRRFLKMLQVRSPLYNEQRRKCPDISACERNKENYLYRVQYETRRNLFKILKTAKKLREQQKLRDLINHVENSISNFVVYKTFRVMPWKIEFTNELYNIMGLAFYDDIIRVPSNWRVHYGTERLRILLHLPKVKQLERASFKFGRKSTYFEPEAIDASFEKHKQHIERLRNRLRFAKYPIEKSYLYHEIARIYNSQSSYDESVPVAKKGVEAAKNCSSFLWEFLNVMQIIKSRAALNKLEYLQESLQQAVLVSKKLNNDELHQYINVLKSTSSSMFERRVRELQKAMLLLKHRKSNTTIRSSVSTVATAASDFTTNSGLTTETNYETLENFY